MWSALRTATTPAFFLTAGILLLALANATKYATAVLDPAVVALAAITVVKRRGLKPGLVRGGYLAAGTLGLVSALLALGGPDYLSGVLSTTLSRAHGSKPASLILDRRIEMVRTGLRTRRAGRHLCPAPS